MCCVRWSNEAATVHADITADHRDVPANLFTSLSEWDEAQPKNLHAEPFIGLFVLLNLLLYGFRNLNLANFLSTDLCFSSISELSAGLRVGNLWIGLHSPPSLFPTWLFRWILC